MPVLTASLLLALSTVGCTPPSAAAPASDDSGTYGSTDVPLETDNGADTGAPPDITAAIKCPDGIVAINGATKYTTLQEAVGSSGPGDVIEVCPGRWTESVSIPHDGPLTLSSVSGNAEDTVLDGEYQRRIIYRSGLDPTYEIKNISFIRGVARWSSTGGGMTIIASSPSGSVVVEGCVFSDNGPGEALYLKGLGSAHIRRSIFRNQNGGVSANGAVTLSIQEELLIEDSLFENNHSFMYGGAISLKPAGWPETHPEFIIRRSTFRHNDVSAYDGSAIYVDGRSLGNPRRVVIEDCLFEDNAQDRHGLGYPDIGGGGAFAIATYNAAYEVEITRTTFRNNQGTPASALRFFDWVPGQPLRAVLTDVQVYGGRPLPYPSEVELDNLAIDIADTTWRVEFNNVDLGTGADANPYPQFGGCWSDITGILDGMVLDLTERPGVRCPWRP